jgi:hypothetical protein
MLARIWNYFYKSSVDEVSEESKKFSYDNELINEMLKDSIPEKKEHYVHCSEIGMIIDKIDYCETTMNLKDFITDMNDCELKNNLRLLLGTYDDFLNFYSKDKKIEYSNYFYYNSDTDFFSSSLFYDFNHKRLVKQKTGYYFIKIYRKNRNGVKEPEIDTNNYPLFTNFKFIEKENGKLRFILSCYKQNLISITPSSLEMPIVEKIIPIIKKSKYAVIFDFSSWYNQIPLSEEVSRFFSIVTNQTYYPFGKNYYSYNRLPMGWKWSPYLACSIGRYILDKACEELHVIFKTVWIDDGIATFDTEEDAKKCRDKVEEICEKYNIKLKFLEISQNFNYVGVNYDLINSKCRLKPEWCEKIMKRMDAIIEKYPKVKYAEIRKINGIRKWIQRIKPIECPEIKELINKGGKLFSDSVLENEKINKEILHIYDALKQNEWF